MGALKKETFVPMAFFKKEAYTGSFKGMRYRVVKADDQFEAVVYPEPYCFEATPELEQGTEGGILGGLCYGVYRGGLGPSGFDCVVFHIEHGFWRAS